MSMSQASKSNSSRQEVQSENEGDSPKIEVSRGHSAVTVRLKGKCERRLLRMENSKQHPHLHQTEGNEGDHSETEYLMQALSETIEENARLKKRLSELEALLAAAHDEIEDRDSAICELTRIVTRLSKEKREERLILDNIELAFQKSE